jgi:hypothetical protein
MLQWDVTREQGGTINESMCVRNRQQRAEQHAGLRQIQELNYRTKILPKSEQLARRCAIVTRPRGHLN